MWLFPPGTRFVVPVLPLILLAMWEGFQSVRPSVRMVRITATIAGLIVVVSAVTGGGYARLTNAHVKPSLHRYEWIRSNSMPGDVIACVLDANCYLYTDRKAVSIAIADVAPFYGPEGKFRIHLERLAEIVRTSNAAYVMLEPVSRNEIQADLSREAVRKLKQESPGQLEEVGHDDSEKTTIYRVRVEKTVKGTPFSLR